MQTQEQSGRVSESQSLASSKAIRLVGAMPDSGRTCAVENGLRSAMGRFQISSVEGAKTMPNQYGNGNPCLVGFRVRLCVSLDS
jgi:hypothetical protein